MQTNSNAQPHIACTDRAETCPHGFYFGQYLPSLLTDSLCFVNFFTYGGCL